MNEYDLYDVDRCTLAPLRSISRTEEQRVELTFAEGYVVFRKTTKEGTTIERIRLPSPVEAEGPGTDVLVANLPLAVGLKKRYIIVDRWSDPRSSRVKPVTLSVLKRDVENTTLGMREVFELLIKAEDDSFQIKEKVLAQSPHFPIRVEYTRDGKTYPASEVVALAN